MSVQRNAAVMGLSTLAHAAMLAAYARKLAGKSDVPAFADGALVVWVTARRLRTARQISSWTRRHAHDKVDYAAPNASGAPVLREVPTSVVTQKVSEIEVRGQRRVSTGFNVTSWPGSSAERSRYRFVDLHSKARFNIGHCVANRQFQICVA